jgi:hypothetical protein
MDTKHQLLPRHASHGAAAPFEMTVRGNIWPLGLI